MLLIGMPMCGKSTVARILSKNLKFNYLDTDKEIEKTYEINY